MATFVISILDLTTLCYYGARAGEHTQAARASQSSHQKPASESFLERKRSKRAKVDMAIRNASTPIGAAASLTPAMVAVRARVYDVFGSNTKVDDKGLECRAVAMTEGRIGTGWFKSDIVMNGQKKNLNVRELAIEDDESSLCKALLDLGDHHILRMYKVLLIQQRRNGYCSDFRALAFSHLSG